MWSNRNRIQGYKECLKNNKILKSQKRFRNEAHNGFTEKFNKIALSANDEKRIQVADRVISQPYGTVLGIVQSRTGETIKYKKMNIIINFNKVTEENRQEHNWDWLQIPDHPCRILIVRGSRSRKTNYSIW